MRSSEIIIICVFFAILNFASSDLPNGAFCYLKNGASGVCVEISSCPEIRNLLATRKINRNQVTVCNKPKRFLCCPSQPVEEETTSRAVFTNANYSERISEKKCKEYGEKVLQKVIMSSLIINEKGVETITSKCQHKSVSLIVGGQAAKLHEFPHQALLGYQNNQTIEWICGGSLISPDFVLTAAHCISSSNYGKVKFIKFAVHDRLEDGNKTIVSTVLETFKFSTNRQISSHNDIALIKLQESIKIDEFTLPACLPTRPYDDAKAVVTGFGENGRGVLTQKLMKVVIEKFDEQVCKNMYEGSYNGTTMLCYGHHTERKDSCEGDSGGPLQVSNEKQVNCTYTVIGIVSFGPKHCGVPGAAGAYVNVFKYLDWIEGIVWNGQF